MRLTIIALLLYCTGCVTSSSKNFEAVRVVERIGQADETPEWANGSVAMLEEKGDVVFINQTTMAGNARPEACVKAAEMDARAQMLRHIKDNVVTSGQLNEVSASDDPGYESLTAFFSSGKITGAKIGARYWERVEESDEAGDRVLRMKCAIKVAVKKSELSRQLREAIDGPKGDPKVRAALNKATTDFIDGLSSDAGK